MQHQHLKIKYTYTNQNIFGLFIDYYNPIKNVYDSKSNVTQRDRIYLFTIL